MMITEEQVQQELKALNNFFSFREIERLFPEYTGIPPGTLSSIAKKGIVPKKWRTQLNIKDEGIVVEPCIECGKIHRIVNTCPSKKKVSRPRRVAIRTDNMNSAAQTILRNIQAKNIEELVYLLQEHEEAYKGW